MSGVQIILFAGTSEGRTLGSELAAQGVSVLLCVATEYGGEMVMPQTNLQVHEGRLDSNAMQALISSHACPLVIDATHPYAAEVTKNLKDACTKTGAEYIRLLRESWEAPQTVQTVESTQQAAQVLDTIEGRVLLTVGSKELGAFQEVENYRERLFARVLPSSEIVAKCEELGFSGRQLICMQGPFTHDVNVAMIRMLNIQCLVTKDSGTAGGFAEKLSAVQETGISMLLIKRPFEEKGLSLSQVRDLLYKRFEIVQKKQELPTAYPRFPLFINLQNKRVCVVGGGKIATRRIQTLLSFGANIEVISPELTDTLKKLAEQETIVWRPRVYQTGDCIGAAVVLAATHDRTVNAQVGNEAYKAAIPVSVADDAKACTFYFPAIVRTKDFIAGLVSVGGNRHKSVKKTAALLRERLEELCE